MSYLSAFDERVKEYCGSVDSVQVAGLAPYVNPINTIREIERLPAQTAFVGKSGTLLEVTGSKPIVRFDIEKFVRNIYSFTALMIQNADSPEEVAVIEDSLDGIMDSVGSGEDPERVFNQIRIALGISVNVPSDATAEETADIIGDAVRQQLSFRAMIEHMKHQNLDLVYRELLEDNDFLEEGVDIPTFTSFKSRTKDQKIEFLMTHLEVFGATNYEDLYVRLLDARENQRLSGESSAFINPLGEDDPIMRLPEEEEEELQEAAERPRRDITEIMEEGRPRRDITEGDY